MTERINPKALIDQVVQHYEKVLAQYEDGASATVLYAEILGHIHRLEALKDEQVKACMLAELRVSGKSGARVEGVASYGLSPTQVLDKNAWELAVAVDPGLAQLEEEARAAAERLRQAQEKYKVAGSPRFYFKRM